MNYETNTNDHLEDCVYRARAVSKPKRANIMTNNNTCYNSEQYSYENDEDFHDAGDESLEWECPGCESGVDHPGDHTTMSGDFHPRCCVLAELCGWHK